VEAAIDLAGIVAHVTVLEFEPALRADAVLLAKLASLSNVDVITQSAATEVTGDGSKVDGLVYTERSSGRSRRLDLEGVFVQIGLLPNTEWLADRIALTPRGEIEVDARGRTSAAGVFAAGDCTSVPFKQIIISMGAGASAALGAFEHLIRAPVPA
jgi:alkyl hydroperoxide reductase subunit F